jgi:hypothetical protein
VEGESGIGGLKGNLCPDDRAVLRIVDHAVDGGEYCGERRKRKGQKQACSKGRMKAHENTNLRIGTSGLACKL